MSELIRSFLAFDLDSEAVVKRLAAVQKLLIQTGADLKLVEPENIHITVRFLGDITSSVVEKIFEQMKSFDFSPFDVHVCGLGAFPDLRYPRVLWAGMAEGADQLKNVFNQIEPRLRSLGFLPDSKGFSPHLTIARVRSGANKVSLSEFVKDNASYDFGIVRAACLRLKKSELTPKGPIYTTLREFCPPER